MENNKLLHSILNQINECLIDYILKTKEIKRLDSFGLYNGEFGLFLYLVLYNKRFPDSFLEEKIELFVDQLLFKWTEYPDSYTYCMGTSGVLDLIYYLNENDIYQIDLNDGVDYLEDYIAKIMIADLSEGKYDFLHESLGPANYLLNKNTKLDYVEKFIDILYENSIKGNGSCKWPFLDILSGKLTYNISMSHGISSIIIFLAKAYKKNIRREKVYELLLGSSSYILSQKLDVISSNLSIYPSISKKDGYSPSRLGWCYGDLGIAVALWTAGEIIATNKFLDEAIYIVEKSFLRKDLSSNMIQDAGICHGSAGVSMMFQFFWEKMKIKDALILRDYWLSETINMIPPNNQKLMISDWCNNSYDLLMGISGIGLMLLSSITNDYSWKRLFLL